MLASLAGSIRKHRTKSDTPPERTHPRLPAIPEVDVFVESSSASPSSMSPHSPGSDTMSSRSASMSPLSSPSSQPQESPKQRAMRRFVASRTPRTRPLSTSISTATSCSSSSPLRAPRGRHSSTQIASSPEDWRVLVFAPPRAMSRSHSLSPQRVSSTTLSAVPALPPRSTGSFVGLPTQNELRTITLPRCGVYLHHTRCSECSSTLECNVDECGVCERCTRAECRYATPAIIDHFMYVTNFPAREDHEQKHEQRTHASTDTRAIIEYVPAVSRDISIEYLRGEWDSATTYVFPYLFCNNCKWWTPLLCILPNTNVKPYVCVRPVSCGDGDAAIRHPVRVHEIRKTHAPHELMSRIRRLPDVDH